MEFASQLFNICPRDTKNGRPAATRKWGTSRLISQR